jgi:hypothetical protein
MNDVMPGSPMVRRRDAGWDAQLQVGRHVLTRGRTRNGPAYRAPQPVQSA